MTKICLGCNKEFLAPTPFISFCDKCLKEHNYKKENQKEFEESYSEMCDYCAEIESSQYYDIYIDEAEVEE